MQILQRESNSGSRTVLTIYPKKSMRVLLYAIGLLTFFSLTVLLIQNNTNHGRLLGFGSLFNVGAESNLPTWYSSFTLLLCSSLLWIISRTERASGGRDAFQWGLLSVFFLALSIDELCCIHERLGTALDSALPSSALLHFGWVLPAAIITGIILMPLAAFVWKLPSPTRRLFIIAGVIYFSGAFGFEMIGGDWRTAHGENNVLYSVIMTLEELLEMTGTLLFIYASILHIAEYVPNLEIRFSADRPS